MSTTPTPDAAYWIGLDPGQYTGWAVLDPAGDRMGSGVWNVAERPGEGGGMRYVRFAGSLRALLDAYPGAHLCYERPVYASGFSRPGMAPVPNTNTALVAGGYIGQILYVCEVRRVPYRHVNPSTVKRGATGKGVARKEQMVIEANSRWGLEIPVDYHEGKGRERPPTFPGHRDNEADALWIAEAGRVGLT